MSTIEDRVRYALLDMVSRINGNTKENMDLHLPKPYKGWIDFYYDHNNYCSMFDLETEYGGGLMKLFESSEEGRGIYHFKPTPSFEVRGRLIAEGKIDRIKWVVLNTVINGESGPFLRRIPNVNVKK